MGTDYGNVPSSYQCKVPKLVLMLVILKNGFFSFYPKLEHPFSQFNDILIMHPVRYILNEIGFTAQLTAIYGLVSSKTIDVCNGGMT